MGNNVNLCQMLNAPEKLDCQRCKTVVNTDFDDYDIDCGNPNPAPGHWRLRYYCFSCGYSSEWVCALIPAPTLRPPDENEA